MMKTHQTPVLINPLLTESTWGLNKVLFSTVAADALVLKHQDISIHNGSNADFLMSVVPHILPKKWLIGAKPLFEPMLNCC